MFKQFNNLSPSLNKGIQLFTERLDMTQRDRQLFYDIIGFTFDEGKIKGAEEYLNETKKENEQE